MVGGLLGEDPVTSFITDDGGQITGDLDELSAVSFVLSLALEPFFLSVCFHKRVSIDWAVCLPSHPTRLSSSDCA